MRLPGETNVAAVSVLVKHETLLVAWLGLLLLLVLLNSGLGARVERLLSGRGSCLSLVSIEEVVRET